MCNTPTEIFKKNEELNSQVNRLRGGPSSFIKGGGTRSVTEDSWRPTLQEVKDFFTQNKSSPTEAHKFFHYNQAKNWMLTEKLPITDWKALARKWMLNLNSNSIASEAKQPHLPKPLNMNETIQQLYELYLKGEKINKFILPEFADHLQLEITDTIKQEAIQRRINQLSGSNEASETKLWTAYMKEDFEDELLINDQPNLTALAKRIAVAKYFQQLKNKQQKTIP